MACLIDSEKCQSIKRFEHTRGISCIMMSFPLLELFLLEILLIAPLKSFSPSLGTVPACEIIFVSIVNQNWKIFVKKIRQIIPIVKLSKHLRDKLNILRAS